MSRSVWAPLSPGVRSDSGTPTQLCTLALTVLCEHLGQQTDEEEEEQQQFGKLERSIQDAIQALQIVIEFAEGHDDVKTAQLRAIERLEQELEALDINSRVQTTLDTWIT